MNIIPRKTINGIEFTLLGNTEIRNMSSLGKDTPGVNAADLYEGNEPKRGGLIDPRMGTTDENIPCATCGLNSYNCVGHFGHIKLEDTLYHVGFLPFVKKILGCVCIKCSKLLVYKNEAELNEILRNKTGKNRLSAVRELVKEVQFCQRPNVGCGAPVPKIKMDTKKTNVQINMVAEFRTSGIDDATGLPKKAEQIILTPQECYNILKNISDDDCRILGIEPIKNRPEDMLHQIFPVPPVAVRPSVQTDGSSANREDDLTRIMADIVKRNEFIGAKKAGLASQMSHTNNENTQLLQYHVATYFDNESPMLPKSEQKGKQLKSLSERLKGKEGRFRSNLMGKRVDFSARSVITPDTNISINQVGVPLSIVMNLTYPEIVTSQNMEQMKQLIRNGKDIYPGANFVITQNGFRIDLRFKKEKVSLRVGDIVERHLVNGDIVMMNRQPTLHKQSMMGHYVQVLVDDRYESIRINVGVTQAYNGDFDGKFFEC